MKSRNFFIFAVVAALVGLGAVFADQHHASSLASALLKRNAAGFNTTTDQQTLANYAQHHMGVSEKLFLAGSYNQAVQAAQLAANPLSNGAIYAQAQAACASHADSITQANCVQAYVNGHTQPSANPQAVAIPAKAAYTKSFTAPGWTPDVAGIAFLVAIVAAAGAAYLLALRR
jgi:hypothetical protein